MIRSPTLARHGRALLLAACLVATALACAAPPLAAQRRARTDAQSLQHGGTTRSYVVRAPRTIARGERLPVVLVLHGGGGNAANAERMTGFTRLVERERVLVVYPEGTPVRTGMNMRTWNAGHCCGLAMRQQADDIGFLATLLDTLRTQYPVDTTRIYATGMSNGAMMAHRVGRELSSRIAAIAPVVGALFGDEVAPPHPVAALNINGLLDESVPPNGGLSGGLGRNAWDGTPARPNLEQGTFWARTNGCGTTPARTQQGTVIRWRWPCPAGRDVELLQLTDVGHAWPGGQRGSPRGDAPGTTFEATNAIWAFFTAHRK